jgi:sulfur-oxidizing protein SoxA
MEKLVVKQLSPGNLGDNMKKLITAIALVVSTSVLAAEQDPRVKADIDAFQTHFAKTFPNMKKEQFANGPYQFNEDKLMQFEAQMDMPPFEDHVDKGEVLWNAKLKNGKTLSSCFSMPLAKIKSSFPRWNEATGKVETLEAQINACKVANGGSKWGWKKGNMAYVSAYLNGAGAGSTINVIVPKGDDKAFAAWSQGKNEFYAKRGQLNLSCADCHVYSPGKRIRGNILSPALGQITHFPVWRGKWAKKKGDGFGTIQRRYGGCNKMVRAQPKKAQGPEYTNLEYFHTSMSNGMEYNGVEYRE